MALSAHASPTLSVELAYTNGISVHLKKMFRIQRQKPILETVITGLTLLHSAAKIRSIHYWDAACL